MQRTQLAELFAAFFRIGLTSFGMAILQNLKAMTLRRRFLSEQAFREGLALVQFYPGPIMVDLVAFIGYRNHGVLGALVATIGFLLPATALMMLASAAYLSYGNLPAVEIMLSGLNALVVGVVLNVTLDFAQKNLNSSVEAALALLAFILGILHVDPLWAVLGGLLLGAFVWRNADESAPLVASEKFGWSKLVIPGLVCLGLVIIAAWAAYYPSPLGDLAAVFMKIGAVAFGNGATILPVMQQAVVGEHHWLTPSQFGTAIGLGQITPGPILNSATFVGYLVAGPSGALAATFAIFAPSFAMTLIFTELFAHVRHLGAIQGAIRGVMAVFVGLLAGITLSLGQQALMQPMAFAFAAAALVALRYLKWDMLVVLTGGLLAWGGWSYLEATIGKP